MRKFIAVICITLGFFCITGSVGLVFYNRWEDDTAEKSSQSMLENIQDLIDENRTEETSQGDDSDVIRDNEIVDFDDRLTGMPTVEIYGYECIGILSAPTIELELPVLTDWSYAKLKKAPCHYYGSYYEKDFVIAGHNYTSHFGRLSLLKAGDVVVFTDVNGVARYYEVVLLETLPAKATKEMIVSGFDLSLYTCTLGGDSRVTVRCNAVSGDD